MGGLMAGIYWVINRRMKLAALAADSGLTEVPTEDVAGESEDSDV